MHTQERTLRTQFPVPYDESPIEAFGRAADEQVRLTLFAEYHRTLGDATLRRHRGDIAVFMRYLKEKTCVVVGDMFSEAREWTGVTWGIAYGFREWMIEQGYAMGSVDIRVVTIKKYMRLANASGYVSDENVLKLADLKSHDEKMRRNIDQKRDVTRLGHKKAQPTLFSVSHLQMLRKHLIQDDTYIGRRDLLLLCLLGYHALRCSEVHDLRRGNIDMGSCVITFYRRKVAITDNHAMTPITLMAIQRYLEIIPEDQDLLFLGVKRSPHKDKMGKEYQASESDKGLSTRAINDRVGYFGRMVGVANLSPHDLRHACVDDLFKNGTPIEKIKEFGGWKTYAMPERYRRKNKIGNEGVKQSQW